VGESAIAAIRAVAARLDLNPARMDFSLLPDGQALFFEVNAMMLVHPEDDARLAYKNASMAEILDAVEAMIARQLRCKSQLFVMRLARRVNVELTIKPPN
jgi:hypothetical protein